MNRYRFVNTFAAVTAEKIAAKKVVTNIDELLALTKNVGKYVFEASKELTDKMRQATAGEMKIDVLPDGKTKVNRMIIETPFGNFRLRVTSTDKQDFPARAWTADELKALEYGFCKSDGELVTETVSDSAGNVYEVPIKYVSIK